jgi:hypothetical protein
MSQVNESERTSHEYFFTVSHLIFGCVTESLRPNLIRSAIVFWQAQVATFYCLFMSLAQCSHPSYHPCTSCADKPRYFSFQSRKRRANGQVPYIDLPPIGYYSNVKLLLYLVLVPFHYRWPNGPARPDPARHWHDPPGLATNRAVPRWAGVPLPWPRHGPWAC